MALPWASSVDVSYVGNHGYNRLGGFQGGTHGQPERGRHRRGVPAAEPGPDAGPSTVPGANAYRQPAAAVPRARQHQPEHHGVPGHVSLDSDQLQPPLPERVRVRRELHLSLSLTGNTGLQQRLQHAPTARSRFAPTRRSTRALNENLAILQRTSSRPTAVWDLPNASAEASATSSGAILNDWQLSGVFTGELRRPLRSRPTATRTTARPRT